MQTFSPDTLLPFDTYRTPRQDGRGFQRGPVESSSSLAHFFFSERFRGYDDARRIELLGYPSAAAARKVVAKEEAHPKWIERQDQLVRCALWKQFCNLADRYRPLSWAGEIALNGSQCLGKGWEIRHNGNERWSMLVRSVATRFVTRDSFMSLLPTGDTDINNPFLFSSRLDVLLAKRLPDQIVIACRQGVDALAELWSIERYLPVIHHPLRAAPSSPIKPEALDSLVTMATHAILFAKDDSPFGKSMLAILKAQDKPTRKISLDEHGRPVPKAPAPSSTARPRR